MEPQKAIQNSTTVSYFQLKDVLMRTANAIFEKPRHEHFSTVRSRVDSHGEENFY
jgi:hypothetical protein